MRNYQNEILTTTIDTETLAQQLLNYLKEGKTYIILPSAWEYKIGGFISATTLTVDEYLERRLEAYEDEKTWDEETAELDFYEWLELDAQVYDDLYLLIDDVLDHVTTYY